jgi:hypothetical protein
MTWLLLTLSKIKFRTWCIVATYAFAFALGLSVHGCHQRTVAAPQVSTVIRWDTLPAPAAVHDTVRLPVLKWAHDTVRVHDTTIGGKLCQIAAVEACEAFDTTTPGGTHASFRQCFLLPDSVIRRAAQPPVLSIQEPPPVERVVTKTVTVTEIKKAPINWTVELLKAGIFVTAGALAGSRL